MQIVVTDGYTLNPGDLSWHNVENFGRLAVYDRTPEDKIIERCHNANIILTNKTPLNKTVLQQLSSLQLICVTATGYNVVDVPAARDKNVTVCNVPAYGTASVAQHTIALLLELTNQVGVHASSVASGEWVQARDWSYSKSPVMELAGKTMGIVGYGNIGKQTGRIAEALGMQVLYHVPVDELFATSDVVSLHCPLTKKNAGFVDRSLLNLMKPTAYLINTARGGLINEQDLADALNNGVIAGAALDVLSSEPPSADNPLLKARHCVITPHNAWISKEARQRIMDVTVGNIKAFVEGHPQNTVN